MKQAPENLLFYLFLAGVTLALLIVIFLLSWLVPLLLKIILLAAISAIVLVFLFGQGAQMKSKAQKLLQQIKEECRLRQEQFTSES